MKQPKTPKPKFRKVKGVKWIDLHPEHKQFMEDMIAWYIQAFGEHPLEPKPC